MQAATVRTVAFQGIDVLPVDVNASLPGFAVERDGRALRTGLAHSSASFGVQLRNSIDMSVSVGMKDTFFYPRLTEIIGVDAFGTPRYDTVSIAEAGSLVELAQSNIATLPLPNVTATNPSVLVR